MRSNRLVCFLSLLSLFYASASGLVAQSPSALPGGFTPPSLEDFGALQGLGGLGGSSADPVKIEAHIAAAPGDPRGMLVVTATVDRPYHIYSVTQPPGGPEKTRILPKPSDDYRLLGEFQAATPPKTHVDDRVWKGLTIEEHEGRVEWSAPIEITAGANVEELAIEGTVTLQACDPSQCIPLALKFTARHDAAARPRGQAKPAQLAGPVFQGSYSRQNPRSESRLSGFIEPAVVAPGGEAKLVLTITPGPGWHAYALEEVEPNKLGNKPTLLVIESSDGLQAGEAATDAALVEKEPNQALVAAGFYSPPYYQGAVTFTIPIQVPAATPAGPRQVSGIVGFQICEEDGQCEMPQGARFQASLQIEAPPATGDAQPLTFAGAEYADAAKAAATRAGAVAAVAPAPTTRSIVEPPIASAADYDLSRLELREVEERSIGYYLAIAFLGGIILNLMPCVLPVIGLKVMSFVQQAGQSRAQAFALNLWYAGGILAVFLVLAGLAAGAGMNMGDQFSSLGFNVFMCALVFAMALSLLGVWEIPIPGFVGGSTTSKWMDREGPTGAFLKGVFTTILATPCLGPLMAPALGWAVGQSAGTTFLVFAVLGLGMSLPYLAIGAYPGLIRFIPKPGAWMVTFKQVMGFVLLGTVLFFLSFMPPDSIVPTVTMLTGIGLACWWIARIPITAGFDRKLSGWLVGGAIAAGMTWLAFGWLHQEVMQPRLATSAKLLADRRVGAELEGVLKQLTEAEAQEDRTAVYTEVQRKLESLDSGPYQPFSLAKLERLAVQEGKTVLVDFTADWCLNCKALEAAVLHTQAVESTIGDQGVVTMKADYTHKPEWLARVLRALGSNGVPVIAIFPGDDPYRPFVFRGAYTKDGILAALDQSGHGPARMTVANQSGNEVIASAKVP